jgi:predicted RNase H-like HicB family nuclease
MPSSAGPYVQVQPLPDGSYRAMAPAKPDLFADGATPQEAENLLLELLERRIEIAQPVARPEPVELDPDEVLDKEDA